MLLNLILCVAFGAVIGWIAMLLTAKEGENINSSSVLVGAISALLSGMTFYAFNRSITVFEDINFTSLVVSSLGALTVVLYMRRLDRGL
jgi:uncharacterized membrane protein YeaQ/YmgE (transglycosylase-associated protein family)